MSSGRILALDYGSKNVGLACSDELGITIQPLASVPNSGKSFMLSRIKATVGDLGIARIVFGLPWNMDGTEGPAIERVRRFMDAVAQELALPLDGVDERLSTVEATEIWNRMPARQRRRYRTVDSLAAALILE